MCGRRTCSVCSWHAVPVFSDSQDCDRGFQVPSLPLCRRCRHGVLQLSLRGLGCQILVPRACVYNIVCCMCHSCRQYVQALKRHISQHLVEELLRWAERRNCSRMKRSPPRSSSWSPSPTHSMHGLHGKPVLHPVIHPLRPRARPRGKPALQAAAAEVHGPAQHLQQAIQRAAAAAVLPSRPTCCKRLAAFSDGEDESPTAMELLRWRNCELCHHGCPAEHQCFACDGPRLQPSTFH